LAYFFVIIIIIFSHKTRDGNKTGKQQHLTAARYNGTSETVNKQAISQYHNQQYNELIIKYA